MTDFSIHSPQLVNSFLFCSTRIFTRCLPSINSTIRPTRTPHSTAAIHRFASLDHHHRSFSTSSSSFQLKQPHSPQFRLSQQLLLRPSNNVSVPSDLSVVWSSGRFHLHPLVLLLFPAGIQCHCKFLSHFTVSFDQVTNLVIISNYLQWIGDVLAERVRLVLPTFVDRSRPPVDDGTH